MIRHHQTSNRNSKLLPRRRGRRGSLICGIQHRQQLTKSQLRRPPRRRLRLHRPLRSFQRNRQPHTRKNTRHQHHHHQHVPRHIPDSVTHIHTSPPGKLDDDPDERPGRDSDGDPPVPVPATPPPPPNRNARICPTPGTPIIAPANHRRGSESCAGGSKMIPACLNTMAHAHTRDNVSRTIVTHPGGPCRLVLTHESAHLAMIADQ